MARPASTERQAGRDTPRQETSTPHFRNDEVTLQGGAETRYAPGAACSHDARLATLRTMWPYALGCNRVGRHVLDSLRTVVPEPPENTYSCCCASGAWRTGEKASKL